MRMRPSADVRAPGIYQTVDPVVIPAMTIANTRIAGFMGLSLKGPMNEPTRISSWDEYVDQVGKAMAESTPFFQEALNEILADGQPIFP